MRVLILYECSNVVRDAFRAAGHEAYSCDLTGPADYQEDALGLLQRSVTSAWSIIIAHPPCQYLCNSGIHWNKRRPERAQQTEDAFGHVAQLVNALNQARPLYGWCIENPISILSTRWRKPDQIVQPWQFGDDASKATCLWLSGLPQLRLHSQEDMHPPRFVMWDGKERQRWGNQTDSGQNRLGPSDTRAADRAQTYPGIARAMAARWGAL
jgi:hypothetical protein